MDNLVSVIIPLYNHEKFIEATIKSVVNQTLAPSEIIVINDGSIDGSHAVMQRLCQEYPKIKYFLQTNQGAHATINAAITKTKCKYVAILNSDDIYHPGRLETCLEKAISDHSIDMIATAIKGIDEEGKPIELVWCNYYKSRYEETKNLFLTLIDGNFLFTTSNIFIKKSVFEEIGDFISFRYAHDLDFFLRLIAHNKKIAIINEPLLMYRIHSSNTITEDYRKVFLERDAIVAFHIYSRLTDSRLMQLGQVGLADLTKVLAKAGRLETIFYFFCYFLQHNSLTASTYLWDKDFLNPNFYTIEKNPPDSFLRFERTSTLQNVSESSVEPSIVQEKIIETEFQRLGQIAVLKIGDKLKRYPSLDTLLVRLMRSVLNLYRYFALGGMRRGVIKAFKKLSPKPVVPHSLNDDVLLPGSDQDYAQVLFISHDAGRTGAPIVLLNLLRWIKEHTSLNFKIILRGGGDLSGEFVKLGPTLILSDFDFSVWKKKLSDFINSSPIKLIYSNTAVNGDVIYDLKGIIDIPVISAIHELENSIQRFAPGRLFELVKKYTNLFIAVSDSVKINLELNHAISSERIRVVHSFVPVSEIPVGVPPDSSLVRQELNIDEGMFVVGGCGTTDWRKGPDLFIQVAKTFLEMLTSEERKLVRFVWVGGDLNSQEMTKLNYDISYSGLKEYVVFTGMKKQVLSYFSQFTVFLLSSREDPFPLVCLEVGALEKPIVCFQKGGGTPELVGDEGGFVVPYLSVRGAVHALCRLFREPELTRMLGRQITEKVHRQYDIEIGAKKILSIINEIAPLDYHISG
jgi:glycosyltransferase involved in cell wall biosynthesis